MTNINMQFNYSDFMEALIKILRFQWFVLSFIY